MRDAVTRFEQTSAGITEYVANRPNEANRDLIVTLQAFDRLNQEFVALAEVLTLAASKSSESLDCAPKAAFIRPRTRFRA